MSRRELLCIVVMDFIEEWTRSTDSFLVNSTCKWSISRNLDRLTLNTLVANTNESNMELFDDTADMLGEGLAPPRLFVVTEVASPIRTQFLMNLFTPRSIIN